jgi:hypothetical protein
VTQQALVIIRDEDVVCRLRSASPPPAKPRPVGAAPPPDGPPTSRHNRVRQHYHMCGARYSLTPPTGNSHGQRRAAPKQSCTAAGASPPRVAIAGDEHVACRLVQSLQGGVGGGGGSAVRPQQSDCCMRVAIARDERVTCYSRSAPFFPSHCWRRTALRGRLRAEAGARCVTLSPPFRVETTLLLHQFPPGRASLGGHSMRAADGSGSS